MLKKAEGNLPYGYRLRILDTWRPLALQKELYEFYRQSITNSFNLSCLPKNEQDDFISKYIAIPSEWWHYDYGDENWAKAKGLKALYKGIFSQNEMKLN